MIRHMAQRAKRRTVEQWARTTAIGGAAIVTGGNATAYSWPSLHPVAQMPRPAGVRWLSTAPSGRPSRARPNASLLAEVAEPFNASPSRTPTSTTASAPNTTAAPRRRPLATGRQPPSTSAVAITTVAKPASLATPTQPQQEVDSSSLSALGRAESDASALRSASLLRYWRRLTPIQQADGRPPGGGRKPGDEGRGVVQILHRLASLGAWREAEIVVQEFEAAHRQQKQQQKRKDTPAAADSPVVSPLNIFVANAWLSSYKLEGEWVGAERCWAYMQASGVEPDAGSYRRLMQVYIVAAGGVGFGAGSSSSSISTTAAHAPRIADPVQLKKVMRLFSAMLKRKPAVRFTANDFTLLIRVSIESGFDSMAARWSREAEKYDEFENLDPRIHADLHEAHRRILLGTRAAREGPTIAQRIDSWDNHALTPEQKGLDAPELHVRLVHAQRLQDAERVLAEYTELMANNAEATATHDGWSLDTVHQWLQAYGLDVARGQLAAAEGVWGRMKDLGLKPSATTFTNMLTVYQLDASPAAIEKSDALYAEALATLSGETRLDASHYSTLIRSAHKRGLSDEVSKWGVRARSSGVWDSLSVAVRSIVEGKVAPHFEVVSVSDPLPPPPPPPVGPQAREQHHSFVGRELRRPSSGERLRRSYELLEKWKNLTPEKQRCSPLLPELLANLSVANRADHLMRDSEIGQARFDESIDVANAYLNTHVRHGHTRGAEEIWARMQARGPPPDSKTFRTLMHVYHRAGLEDLSRIDQLYEQMTRTPAHASTQFSSASPYFAAVTDPRAVDAAAVASFDSSSSSTATAASSSPSSTTPMLRFEARDFDALIRGAWSSRHELRMGRQNFVGSPSPLIAPKKNQKPMRNKKAAAAAASTASSNTASTANPTTTTTTITTATPTPEEAADASAVPSSSPFSPPPPSLRQRCSDALVQQVLSWGVRARESGMWMQLSREGRKCFYRARELQVLENRKARLLAIGAERYKAAAAQAARVGSSVPPSNS